MSRSVLLASVVLSVATVPVALAGRQPAEHAYPSAADFARIFVSTTNHFAASHRDRKRISRAHCVEAAPGRYMCTYLVRLRPTSVPQCHLMQARWDGTPSSPITVTLAGRARRCGTLRAAIDSLE
jgi:hypothetical protein